MNEEAIAIVGASCRFPGAGGIDAFWRLLIDCVDAVSEIGPGRWSSPFFYHPDRGEPGKSYSWAAALIDGIDLFEPGFFGISPREAAEMDPQQRLLLELAWHALEDAGIPPSRLAGTMTGVFIGASSTDYGDLRLGDPASGGSHFVSGMTLSILANRLSHIFDLRGPSQVIDTACSSSLVALHEACAALGAGRIEAAIVGGVNLLLTPYPFIGFAQAGMLSRRGRCFAFDARADGYVRGEGGGVVVLKRLARAVADGDPIRAVVHATAANASGRTLGLSLPSAAAQGDLLRGIYRDAGIAPDVLAFVEMHGTGTPAGDPTEAQAVGQVLGQLRQAPLPIGSVKTNIGHLEPASGVAGLIKAMLALERGTLPRSLYGETPNPAIPFERLNLRLPDAAEPIPSDGFAGISSFGFGGVNAHAILAPSPRREVPAAAEIPSPPLMISARSAAALRALAASYHETLATLSVDRRTVLLRAAARRRDHHEYRLVVPGDDPSAGLAEFLSGRADPGVLTGTSASEGKLAFVYSGNGAQFSGMGGEAYRASAAFRAAIDKADAALRPHLGWSAAERIMGDVPDEALGRADIAQPLLFAIQIAITEVLRQMGVAPAGFVGHSVGEIAAAWAADALSLEEAARIIALRSQHQERTRGTGRMAVLALKADEATALLAEQDGGIEIAAINGARSVTVGGPAAALAALGETAAQRGIACRPLDLDFAFHSAAMAPIRDDLIAALGCVASTRPRGDLVSTVTGARVGEGALDAVYWWRNVRDPVRFAAAVDTLVADGHRIFAEIGPNPVLLSVLRDTLKTAEPAGRAIATLRRRAPPGDPFPLIAGSLHAAGHDMSRAPWLDGVDDPRGLPLYPWQRERFWFAPTVEASEQVNPAREHPLLGFRQSGPVPWWINHIDTVLFPLLADHRIDGAAVLPAAAIIEMALAAARSQFPGAEALELRDVVLHRPVVLDKGLRHLQCVLQPDGAWQVASRKRLASERLTQHATGGMGAAAPGSASLPGPKPSDGKTIAGEALYRLAARLGLDYGASFRTVAEVTLSTGADCATLRLDRQDDAHDWLLDPRLLDGAFQGLLALLMDKAPDAGVLLPRRFGRVVACAPFGRTPVRAVLQLTHRGARAAAADILLYDAAGETVAALAECWFAQLEPRRIETQSYLYPALVPAPAGEMPVPVFDQLGELVPRIAAAHRHDSASTAEQALLFEALFSAIAREGDDSRKLPTALLPLARRFGGEALPDSGEIWRSLLADQPEMVAELTLAALLWAGHSIDDSAPALAALRRTSPPTEAARAVLVTVLDEIAAAWPRDRPLRVYEPGPTRLSDRLQRSGIAVISAAKGQVCDLALFPEAANFDPSSIKLVPGGGVLAVMPLPHPLWDVVGGCPDGRAALAAIDCRDVGAARVSDSPWPCEILWARKPAKAGGVSPVAPGSLGLVTHGSGGGGFAAAFEAEGYELTAPETADAGIVFATEAGADPAAQAALLIPRFTQLAANAATRRVPIWLVTTGAQQPDTDADFAAAALWGFGRVLRNETSGLTLRMVDLPSGMPAGERARRLAAELAAAGREREIVWTAAGRHVVRLRHGLPPRRAVAGEQVAAAAKQPGRGERIEWESAEPHAPGPGEIAIEVHAAGLNFRDVMAATGALAEDALLDGFAGPALGLECAGTVIAVGDGVTRVVPGDRVAGFAPAALASRVVTRADAVFPIPPTLQFAAAATLPVAFVTARYSLLTLARLGLSETVLIHAASGGVGLAAIQTAKACGAIVIATAGSREKRAFLRLVGADHVCDSRELRFVGAVRELTGGAGVDVVLNTLAGGAMEASIELLKPFGRFVELGKRDFQENRPIRSRPLRHNISYFSVDVDQLPTARPELAKTLLDRVARAVAAGEIRPLAYRRFAFAEIAEAFHLMQSAQHIGKLVLVPDDNAGVSLPRRSALVLESAGAYVVSGGLSGFGFATARWLAENGAGHLGLISRRGPDTPGAAERVAELEALGATVSIHAAGVADPKALGVALAAIRQRGAPIRGIVHAAAAIIDGTATTLTQDDIARALQAKFCGALNFDRFTRTDPLDFFWLFSSSASFVGAPGQGAYVAANAALEALARRRHAQGLPALAIAWGPIADAGTLAARPAERDVLARRLGVRAMPAARALAALPTLAAGGLPVAALADLVPGESGHLLPIFAEPLFDEVRGAVAETAADEQLLDRLAGLGVPERQALLATMIAGEAARILRLPEDGVAPHRPLAELGMDSLMAIELRLAIEARLRIDVPLVSLADGASAARLAARLVDAIAAPTPPNPIAAVAARYEPLDAFTPDLADLAAEG